MSGNNSSGQFPFSGGAAVILLALGVFIIADNPFHPTRPEVTNNLTTNTENVRARLWQDPFEAVELHRKEQHDGGSKDHDNFNAENHNHIKCYIGNKDEIDNISSEFGAENKTENNSNTKLKLERIHKSNVELNSNIEIKRELNFEPKHNNKTKNPSLVTSTHNFNQLICQLQQKIKPVAAEEYYDLHIIAVMVTGGPYAENKELRIRSRYAVTTGLMSTGYYPVDSEHIGYMDLAKLCRVAINDNDGSEHSEYCDWPAVIPNELYKLSNYAKQWSKELFAENILVLWIDDEAISKYKPLFMLSKLKEILTLGETNKKILLINEQDETLHDKKLTIKFDVIGPASSTTLVKMHLNLNCETSEKGDSEACKLKKSKYGNDNNEIRVFSHRATLNDSAISQSINPTKEYIDITPDDQLHFPGFRRTIVTDSILVDHLLCEMLRRGINPFHDKKHIYTNDKKLLRIGNTQCTNYSVNALNTRDRKDYIVLIGEWDTTYSRNFKRLFKEKIKNVTVNSLTKLANINKSKNDKKHNPHIDWLYSFFYLRGLDGEISENNSSFSGSKNKTKNASEASNSKSYRRSAGANQFDYLRRLADQIADLDKSNSNNGSIRAIGIVGSDAYDKLLILQALRNRFPDVLFFTTDLDARMLHYEENQYTRNLVVASAFGLSPNNSRFPYQGLAFRDSYQTALYNTIQMVINNSDKSQYKKCINFIDQVTGREYKNKCVSPVKMFEIGNRTAVDYSHTNNIRDADNKHEILHENKYEILNYVLILLGVFLLLILLTRNTTRYYIIFIFSIITIVAIWLHTYDLSKNSEFHAMFTGTSVWPDYIIRMVASITAVMFIFYAIINLKRNTIDIISDNNLSNKCIGFTNELEVIIKQENSNFIRKYTELLKVSLTWLFCYNYYDRKKTNERNNPGYLTCVFISIWDYNEKEKDSVKFGDLFFDYIYLSKPQYRFTRITFISLLYLGLSYAILYISSSFPVTPFVGEVSANAGKIIFYSVVIPYIWLIFLVSDITRLNSQFVRLLSKDNIVWPNKILKQYCDKYGLTEDIAVEKLKLDMVVKRSKVVDQLICLPFFVLTLILLSSTSYFDRWDMPPQVAFIILAGAVIALSSANRLRMSAQKARGTALTNLKAIYCTLIFKEANPQKHSTFGFSAYNKKMSVSLKNMIEEIENLKSGPFTPLTQHPIVSAIALPFGGVGGFYIIDILSKMNF